MKETTVEHKLCPIIWDCKDMVELTQIGTAFNRIYKVAVDHMERIKDIKSQRDALVKVGDGLGLKVGFVKVGEDVVRVKKELGVEPKSSFFVTLKDWWNKRKERRQQKVDSF